MTDPRVVAALMDIAKATREISEHARVQTDIALLANSSAVNGMTSEKRAPLEAGVKRYLERRTTQEKRRSR